MDSLNKHYLLPINQIQHESLETFKTEHFLVFFIIFTFFKNYN